LLSRLRALLILVVLRSGPFGQPGGFPDFML
jgi:hypothetical protein